MNAVEFQLPRLAYFICTTWNLVANRRKIRSPTQFCKQFDAPDDSLGSKFELTTAKITKIKKKAHYFTNKWKSFWHGRLFFLFCVPRCHSFLSWSAPRPPTMMRIFVGGRGSATLKLCQSIESSVLIQSIDQKKRRANLIVGLVKNFFKCQKLKLTLTGKKILPKQCGSLVI